jgi:hypothetical protein
VILEKKGRRSVYRFQIYNRHKKMTVIMSMRNIPEQKNFCVSNLFDILTLSFSSIDNVSQPHKQNLQLTQNGKFDISFTHSHLNKPFYQQMPLKIWFFCFYNDLSL